MHKVKQLTAANLLQLYQSLFDTYGPQHWWPASTRFEIMVGAILTQNTAWTNVEKAIQNLKQHNVLKPDHLLSLEDKKLAELIKPSGYFNVKTKRLKNYCAWYSSNGEYQKLNQVNTDDLRQDLLTVNGVGPETADDILLYAFERPVFVIDAYTRRLFSSLSWIKGDEPYEQLRTTIETALGYDDVPLFNEYHALIVRHAKDS